MSVGEWLNTVIRPSDDCEDESLWSGNADRGADDRSGPGSRSRDDDWGPDTYRDESRRRRGRGFDDGRQHEFHRDDPRPSGFHQDFRQDLNQDFIVSDRDRNANSQRAWPPNAALRRDDRKFADERGQNLPREDPKGDGLRRSKRRRRDPAPEATSRHDSRDEDRGYIRYADAPRRQSGRDDNWGRGGARERDRDVDSPAPQSHRGDDWQRVTYPNGPGRAPEHEREDQFRLNFRYDDRERGQQPETTSRPYERREPQQRAVQRESSPYPEVGSGRPYREPESASRRQRERYEGVAAAAAPKNDGDALVDKAVAEITARQRALDTDVAAQIKARQRVLDGEMAAAGFPVAAARAAGDVAAAMPAARLAESYAEPWMAAPLTTAPAAAEKSSIAEPAPPALPVSPEQVRSEWKNWDWKSPGPQSTSPAAPALDLSNLEAQLRAITARIEALRPSSELETAINGLRTDLADIARSLTEALPRRALESLEIEVKALAERIDHTRQSGVETTTLAGIEHGLAEVREALRGLTPAEGLVGFEEAVKALDRKVDAIVAKDDPAALQQLETAIGALRGIVSHVASSDALNKVAEDVRALSAKVDGVANNAANLPALSAIEKRIDMLASALNASTEAGHAVPRELEKLLSGLIEKLEWVQLTQTDHTALTHLEDRIAALVKRLDASDARLGLLEGVERGLADLLVYIEQLRGANGVAGSPKSAVAAGNVAQEVATIEQTGHRTQHSFEDSLEDVHGTVEHVVDRLAMIESDMRVDRTRLAPAEDAPAQISALQRAYAREPVAAVSLEPAFSEVARRPEPPSHRLAAVAAARKPIDPNLPPDHPLEPRAAGRSGQSSSAAERIAASEALAGSKPPVIADPSGGKADFIAAARRAARAATATDEKPRGKTAAGNPAPAKNRSERLRTLIVAAAVVVIVVGGFHIISRLFEDGSGAPANLQTDTPRIQTPQVQTEPPRMQSVPAQVPPEPQVEPPHVQTEPPPPPATATGANSTSLPRTLPVPPPGLDAAQSPGTSPPASAPGTGTGIGPQSPLNDAAPSAAAAPAAGAPLDITGSVHGGSAPRSPTPPTADGKLPLAIGGPALRLAALAGDPAAAYEVATRYAEGRGVPASNEEAAHWFEIAAKTGLAPAQFRLGGLYEKGLGVKKDLAAARDLYRAAADKGHGKAMHNLAVLFAEGVDGKADYRTAAQWFRKAADHGITDSQYNLAVLYARGVGVEQNFAEAYKWFSLAGKEGDQDAARKRDEIASHLDQGTLAAARATVEKWAPLPQPADAVTVRGTWDAPAAAAPMVKPKPRSAKAQTGDAQKIN
jgi:localization factor PodJL